MSEAPRPVTDLPAFAAWQHHDARDGYEVVFLEVTPAGYRFEGHTSAVEDGEPFAVRYALGLDRRWRTRSARVSGRSSSGVHEASLESGGTGRWLVNGELAPELDGCLDVDLESSSFTNALPVRRLGLAVGAQAAAPAAWVRALDLGVERLEQRYTRLPDHEGRSRYDYEAPRFDFRSELVYDAAGLVLDYPGIAVRSA
jgi:uncharacterized protein